MINLLLILLIIFLVIPATGLYVVAGTLGLILKIILVILLVSFVVNLTGANRSRWW